MEIREIYTFLKNAGIDSELEETPRIVRLTIRAPVESGAFSLSHFTFGFSVADRIIFIKFIKNQTWNVKISITDAESLGEYVMFEKTEEISTPIQWIGVEWGYEKVILTFYK